MLEKHGRINPERHIDIKLKSSDPIGKFVSTGILIRNPPKQIIPDRVCVFHCSMILEREISPLPLITDKFKQSEFRGLRMCINTALP